MSIWGTHLLHHNYFFAKLNNVLLSSLQISSFPAYKQALYSAIPHKQYNYTLTMFCALNCI